MEPGGGKNYEDILEQKLQTAKLYDMLNVMQNATNMSISKLLNDKPDDIQQVIQDEIVNKFMNIISEVQKMKAEYDDDEQFHNELADDIGFGFDIPQVFPMNTINLDEGDDLLNGMNNIDDPAPSAPSAPQEPQPVAPIQQPPEPEPVKPQEPAMSPHDQLKALYAKEEAAKQNRQKIKLKLKVGYTVDIYSASKKLWAEGVIKEIKGDVLCVVYGKKMKWLKKDSKQLRPKQQLVNQAVNHM